MRLFLKSRPTFSYYRYIEQNETRYFVHLPIVCTLVCFSPPALTSNQTQLKPYQNPTQPNHQGQAGKFQLCEWVTASLVSVLQFFKPFFQQNQGCYETLPGSIKAGGCNGVHGCDGIHGCEEVDYWTSSVLYARGIGLEVLEP